VGRGRPANHGRRPHRPADLVDVLVPVGPAGPWLGARPLDDHARPHHPVAGPPDPLTTPSAQANRSPPPKRHCPSDAVSRYQTACSGLHGAVLAMPRLLLETVQHAGMCSPTAVLSALGVLARLVWQQIGWSAGPGAVATSSELRSHPSCNVLATRSQGTTGNQRFAWSAYIWSPPPESNRRPHPYHRWSARSGDNAAPRSALQNRKWLAVSRIEKWGAARRYAARLLANHWHASRSDAQWWRA
jgi:hypothetical protein